MFLAWQPSTVTHRVYWLSKPVQKEVPEFEQSPPAPSGGCTNEDELLSSSEIAGERKKIARTRDRTRDQPIVLV